MRIARIITSTLIAASLVLVFCASPVTAHTTPKPPPLTLQTPTVELSLQIISVTTQVRPGQSATLVAQTIPGAKCSIAVYYKSGKSTASGLYPKTANNSGRVSWTWKVGTRTTPGNWPIVVTASYGGKTITRSTSISVISAVKLNGGTDDIVYITRTGAKYHRAGCRYLSQSCIRIERVEAIRRGYTPCSVCHP